MRQWARFSSSGEVGFGMLNNGTVLEYEGDMFNSPRATGRTLTTDNLSFLSPCLPGKIVALWNNFHSLAAKLGKAAPVHRCSSSNRAHP